MPPVVPRTLQRQRERRPLRPSLARAQRCAHRARRRHPRRSLSRRAANSVSSDGTWRRIAEPSDSQTVTRLPHRRRVLARPGRWPGWPRPSRHSRAAPDRAVLRSLSPWWQSSCRCLESSQTSARWLLCGAGTNTTGTCDSATTVEATPSSRPAFAGAPITSSAGRSQRKCGAAGPGRPRRGRGQRAAWRRACEARATGNP